MSRIGDVRALKADRPAAPAEQKDAARERRRQSVAQLKQLSSNAEAQSTALDQVLQIPRSLNVAGLDYDGQISAHHSATGHSLGISAGAGLGGDIFGFSAKAEVKATGKATKMDGSLLLLQYFINRDSVVFHKKDNMMCAEPNAEDEPIKVIMMSGSNTAAEIAIEARAELGGELELKASSLTGLFEENCLGLKAPAEATQRAHAGTGQNKGEDPQSKTVAAAQAKAELSARARIKGEWLNLVDCGPETFTKGDRNLDTNIILTSLRSTEGIKKFFLALFAGISAAEDTAQRSSGRRGGTEQTRQAQRYAGAGASAVAENTPAKHVPHFYELLYEDKDQLKAFLNRMVRPKWSARRIDRYRRIIEAAPAIRMTSAKVKDGKVVEPARIRANRFDCVGSWLVRFPLISKDMDYEQAIRVFRYVRLYAILVRYGYVRKKQKGLLDKIADLVDLAVEKIDQIKAKLLQTNEDGVFETTESLKALKTNVTQTVEDLEEKTEDVVKDAADKLMSLVGLSDNAVAGEEAGEAAPKTATGEGDGTEKEEDDDDDDDDDEEEEDEDESEDEEEGQQQDLPDLAKRKRRLREISRFFSQLLSVAGRSVKRDTPPGDGTAGLCNMSLWGMEGAVDVSASARAAASVGVANAEAGAEASASFEARIGHTAYRIQTWSAEIPRRSGLPQIAPHRTSAVGNEEKWPKSRIVRSTEVIVDYRQVSADASAKKSLKRTQDRKSATSPAKGASQPDQDEKSAGKSTQYYYNMITYRSGTLNWRLKPEHFQFRYRKEKAQTVPPSAAVAFSGTGISNGISLNIDRLRKIVQALRDSAPPTTGDGATGQPALSDADAQRLLDLVKRQLGLQGTTRIETFLRTTPVLEDLYIENLASLSGKARENAITDRLNALKAVFPMDELILESGFGVRADRRGGGPADVSDTIPLGFETTTIKGKDAQGKEVKQPFGFFPRAKPLDHLLGKKNASRDAFELQSLRVRARIMDTALTENEILGKGFPLGFVKTKLSLASVEQSASVGLVDLAVAWYSPGLTGMLFDDRLDSEAPLMTISETGDIDPFAETGVSPQTPYNSAVPPVPLIHQAGAKP